MRRSGSAGCTVTLLLERWVDHSNVMIVFLETSLWVRGILAAVHVNRVRFVFPTHTFLI